MLVLMLEVWPLTSYVFTRLPGIQLLIAGVWYSRSKTVGSAMASILGHVLTTEAPKSTRV
jgi:hypothetical protein